MLLVFKLAVTLLVFGFILLTVVYMANRLIMRYTKYYLEDDWYDFPLVVVSISTIALVVIGIIALWRVI